MTFNQETELLISKFSHELRNPLTAVYSTLQLIEMQHPEVIGFKHWSSLTYDIEYMQHLLDDLSDFAKSERLQPSTFSLRVMLEQLSLSFASSIVDSDVSYTSKIAPSINQITGDKTKLQEVFLNILKNAYEASLPDKSVYMEALAEPGYIVIRVQDTGCGISESHLPTIFDPFVTYKKEGTGLGLAICRHIIKTHKGEISVASKENFGTTFTIKLPYSCLD